MAVSLPIFVHFHVAFSLCPFLSLTRKLSLHFFRGPGRWPRVISFLSLPAFHLQGPCVQIRSYSEVPGDMDFGRTPFNPLQRELGKGGGQTQETRIGDSGVPRVLAEGTPRGVQDKHSEVATGHSPLPAAHGLCSHLPGAAVMAASRTTSCHQTRDLGCMGSASHGAVRSRRHCPLHQALCGEP